VAVFVCVFPIEPPPTTIPKPLVSLKNLTVPFFISVRHRHRRRSTVVAFKGVTAATHVLDDFYFSTDGATGLRFKITAAVVVVQASLGIEARPPNNTHCRRQTRSHWSGSRRW